MYYEAQITDSMMDTTTREFATLDAAIDWLREGMVEYGGQEVDTEWPFEVCRIVGEWENFDSEIIDIVGSIVER